MEIAKRLLGAAMIGGTLLFAVQAMAGDDLTENAKKRGFESCAPDLANMAKTVTGGNSHIDFSTWDKHSPDQHYYHSQVGVRYSDGHSLGLITSIPNGGKCDGAYTRIFTLAQSCQAVRETTFKAWEYKGDLAGLTLLGMQNSTRSTVLMPSQPGDGCVVVMSEFYFDNPAATK